MQALYGAWAVLAMRNMRARGREVPSVQAPSTREAPKFKFQQEMTEGTENSNRETREMPLGGDCKLVRGKGESNVQGRERVEGRGKTGGRARRPALLFGACVNRLKSVSVISAISRSIPIRVPSCLGLGAQRSGHMLKTSLTFCTHEIADTFSGVCPGKKRVKSSRDMIWSAR